jgi:hypothetical protein
VFFCLFVSKCVYPLSVSQRVGWFSRNLELIFCH